MADESRDDLAELLKSRLSEACQEMSLAQLKLLLYLAEFMARQEK